MPLLPSITSEEEYDRFVREPASGLDAMREICRRHGYRSVEPQRYAEGSSIVARLGDGHVVKLYSPIAHDGFETERRALERIDGALPIRTPRVIESGELDGWTYIVMDEMSGVALHLTWEQIPQNHRLAIADQLGRALARLHAIPIETLGIEWNGFIEGQIERCVERQRACGADEKWLVQIPEFLASTDLDTGRTGLVLLHTEVMREHLLVDLGGDSSRLTGLIDFEPAMLGAAEYEFASVGLFVSKGDPAILRAILDGYGYRDDEITADLSRRFMAYALLHRYSNLAWYLGFMPRGETLEELAEEWWEIG